MSSRAHVAVLKVVHQHLSVTEVAVEFGYSRRHLTRLLARYREGGLEALESRSRRPAGSSRTAPGVLCERVIELRRQLVADGADAGPETIRWHLEQEGLRVLSTSTIRRILHRAGLIVPEPRKRPRSSYIRFEAMQPNETWQADVTHWRLADGTDVEVLNWLDDHSRFLLGSTAHRAVSGDDVAHAFLDLIGDHGAPASTLTDNGMIFTTRFVGGRNAFEYLLPILGIQQKNGSPGHPQTQGKIERFHQTQKRWLGARPAPRTVAELQRQLDQFRVYYNEKRPHRALARRTPQHAYHATPKALAASPRPQGHYRIRYDRLDSTGAMSFRRAGRMHHLGTGRANARKRVLALADETHVTVIELDTAEVLSAHLIDANKSYWRNQQKEPGRWPSSPK